jgi:hypothetical protein
MRMTVPAAVVVVLGMRGSSLSLIEAAEAKPIPNFIEHARSHKYFASALNSIIAVLASLPLLVTPSPRQCSM